MPKVFRIVKKKHTDTALEGLGAKRHGGRWNSKGAPVVYASDSIALAALELLVHLKRQEVLAHYVVFQLALTDEQVLALEGDALPADWQDDPPPPSTAEIGDDWLDSGASLALAVPSVIVPGQHIFLLSPQHPEFQAVADQATSFPFE
ncbi:MAG: RES family NAD+ phosphorylase [Pseudomonadota bacterium]|nr:RES family NAD+ phosphorylase [Pseudomonadota bacterium]